MDIKKLFGKKLLLENHVIHFHGEFNHHAIVSDQVHNMFIPSTSVMDEKLYTTKNIHMYPVNPGVIQKALEAGYFLIYVSRKDRPEGTELFVAFGHPCETASKSCYRSIMRTLNKVAGNIQLVHSNFYVRVKVPPQTFGDPKDVKLVVHKSNYMFAEPYTDWPAVGVFLMGRREKNANTAIVIAPLRNGGTVQSLWRAGAMGNNADIRMQSSKMKCKVFQMAKSTDGTEYAFFHMGRLIASMYTEDLNRGQLDKLNKAFA